MPDLHYTHPELAALYDLFNGWSVDHAFYAGLPAGDNARVLEVGCGTGMVARAIAQAGHDVTGIDPAQPMLDVGRLSEGGDLVTWICADLTAFAADPFDLIFMTGHAFQCLITDAEIVSFFRAAGRLLKDGGRLVFESRNPQARAWERWVPDATRVTRHLPDGTPVTEWHDLVGVEGELMSFTSVYDFPDKQLTSHSTLRFADQSLIAQMAREAGLQTRQVWGDWDRSIVTDDSPELIFDMLKS